MHPLLPAALLLTPTLLLPPPAAADAAPSRAPAASWSRGVPATVAGSGRPAPSRQGVWPLAPRPQVARGFAPPASAWGAGHRGVDLVGRPGQAVRTSLAGTVVFAAVLAGRGVVVVEHSGGLRTTYEPVDAEVGVGDVVARGAVLGRLRTTGSHCFPRACLHWGLRRGTAYLDPLVLVGLGPLRLLPLASSGPSGVLPLGSAAGSGLGAAAAPRRLAPTPPAVRSPAWWVDGAGSGARVGLAVRRAQAL